MRTQVRSLAWLSGWLWLWLWCRLAAIALIHPLAWEFTYATGAALKRPKEKKKKKHKHPPSKPPQKRSSLGLLRTSTWGSEKQSQGPRLHLLRSHEPQAGGWAISESLAQVWVCHAVLVPGCPYGQRVTRATQVPAHVPPQGGGRSCALRWVSPGLGEGGESPGCRAARSCMSTCPGAEPAPPTPRQKEPRN